MLWKYNIQNFESISESEMNIRTVLRPPSPAQPSQPSQPRPGSDAVEGGTINMDQLVSLQLQLAIASPASPDTSPANSQLNLYQTIRIKYR